MLSWVILRFVRLCSVRKPFVREHIGYGDVAAAVPTIQGWKHAVGTGRSLVPATMLSGLAAATDQD